MIAVRDWSHTWLKESFATYFAAAWMQHDLGEDEFRTELHDDLHSYLDADRRGRRPIVYNVYHKNGNELFDRHVYEKGSRVLHMLRQILGEEPFWRALQTYTQRNQWREVITADFERAVEEATGRSMAQFFEQWLYKAGPPEFRCATPGTTSQHMAKLTVKQTQKVDERTPLFVTPVDLGFMVPERDDVERQRRRRQGQPDDDSRDTGPGGADLLHSAAAPPAFGALRSRGVAHQDAGLRAAR